ncbi:MAG: hypothetical protein WCE66_01745, partial [Azonexus sp.]
VESALPDRAAWRAIRLIWRNPFSGGRRDTRPALFLDDLHSVNYLIDGFRGRKQSAVRRTAAGGRA